MSRQFRRILPSLEQLPQRVAADDNAYARYSTPSFAAYTASRSPKMRFASDCSQPCTRSLICCASASAGSASESTLVLSSKDSALAVEPSDTLIVLPRNGNCAPSFQ